MGNLIWTGILYFSTSAIVFITYRTFVNDRKADALRKTNDAVIKTQAQVKARESDAMSPAPRRVNVRRPAIGDMKAPVAR